MHSFAKGSILRKWLLSYLLILLIPVSGTLISYQYTRSVITQEIYASNQTALSGIMTGVNDLLEQVQYTAESILTSSRLKELANLQRSYSSFTTRVSDMVKFLHSFEYPIRDTEILVYLSQQDYLITGSTGNPLPRIAASVELVHGTTDDAGQYARTFRQVDVSGQFLFSGDYAYTLHGQDNIVYRRSYKINPVTDAAGGYATVFVNTSFDQLAGYFTQIEDGVVLVFDRQGQLLFHWGDTLLDSSILTLHQPDKGGTLTYTLNDERYLGVSNQSDVCGWTFVLLMPESRFWQSADYITTITMVLLLLSLLLGVVVTLILLEHNYRPVSRTLRSIAPGYSGDDRINEFDVIRDSYLTLMHAHQDTQHIIATQQETFRDSYLFSHLHGFHGQLPDSEIQSFLRLNFADKAFAIISFLIGNERVPTEDADDSREHSVTYVLDSLFTRAFVGSYTVYRLPKDQVYTWLIVLTPEQQADFIDIATEKLSSIVQCLRQSVNAPASALLSDVLSSFGALPDAYQEILSFTQYQYITGSEGVVRVSSFAHSHTSPIEDEGLDLFIQAIAANRPGDACTALRRLLACQRAQPDTDVWLLRLRVYGWLSRVLEQECILARVDEKHLKKRLAGLLNASTPAAISDQLMQLTLFLCNEAPSALREDKRISPRVQAYINAHYADSGLCLSAIAEVFGLSPQYLSRLYRAETESSLLDYINTVRISHAKELLDHSGMTVARVSELVGYTSVKTFRRAFTRYEDTTPGKYEEVPSQL